MTGLSPLHTATRPDGPHICLVTDDAHPALSASDAILAAALQAHSARVSVRSWQDPWWHSLTSPDERLSLSNTRPELVVIRSSWNYHHHIQEYAGWLSHLRGHGVPVQNDPDLITANLDKIYLADLAARGLRVAPAVALDAIDAASIALVMDEQRWPIAVLKPRWCASGHGVRLIDRAHLLEDLAKDPETLPRDRPCLLQRFMPEIAKGEVSLVFIEGACVHAVRKTPQGGEFRVNSAFSPSVVQIAPDPQLVADALAVLRTCKPAPLYARIDGVERYGRLVILEVELNEPGLFLHLDPSGHAADAFADAILRRVAQSRETRSHAA
jgi:glutathione synthase/RimK-type ligase-like ATP-grasp enzyme